ncbi:glycosyl hydrolase catalytic core-domain-containing protein [Xylariaceae sp. FL0016]|nr:glycosyl hydrolase catalytic core-domain-containing protein [Xylariaceae sp. FL0016]
MYNKASFVALCAAAAVNEVAAGSVHHRHMHPKRDVVYAETDTVIVTDWVTVTAGDEQPTAAAVAGTGAKAVTSQFSEAEATTAASSATYEAADYTVSTTSIPASTPAAVEEPSVSPTTLMTSVVQSSATQALTTQLQYPSTTSSSAAAASSTVAASSSGGQRGAAYNDAALVEALLTLGSDLSWAYNWGSTSSGLSDQITYYPMLWSAASDHSSDWNENAQAAIDAGSDCLLSFNEPDNSGQANMTPEDAATQHISFMNPFADKARISSPAITSSENSGEGIDWLNSFFDACAGNCQVDFCAAHWYGPGGTDGANTFLAHVKAVHEACDNKPVWMTEFATTSGDTDEFMSAVVEAFGTDEYSFVEKYSYFMVSVGSLMESATSLSTYGKIFAGLS